MQAQTEASTVLLTDANRSLLALELEDLDHFLDGIVDIESCKVGAELLPSDLRDIKNVINFEREHPFADVQSLIYLQLPLVELL